MDKEWCGIYTMEYYSAIKRMKAHHSPQYEWTLSTFMLSEISQRKTNTIWSHLYTELKKNQIYAKQAHIYKEQING